LGAKYRAPRGTTDVVFPESEKLERLVGLTSEILRLHGYNRIETPVLESTELFVRSIGRETDIVNKEMYTFEDQGGESLTLRPEGTAPVIRAYLERSLASRGLPQKLYYCGPMFRRERPQAGRFRQFSQVGAEVIGSDDPFVDAEVISVSDLVFMSLGLKRYRLLMNSVGCRECRPSYQETLVAYLEKTRGDLCDRCARRASVNPLRVFDCKEEGCRELIAEAPAIGDHLCDACLAHFQSVLSNLDNLGVSYVTDHRLVRGLDYYARTAFEFQFDGLGAQNAVSAGGRYDYLAEELEGPPTPGVGFSMGLERLALSLSAEGLDPFEPTRLDVFVAGVEDADREKVLATLTGLRRAGISADADFQGRSLKSQMKQADRLNVRLVMIIGGAELGKGEVVLRDLGLSSQWNVPSGEVVRSVSDYLLRRTGR